VFVLHYKSVSVTDIRVYIAMQYNYTSVIKTRTFRNNIRGRRELLPYLYVLPSKNLPGFASVSRVVLVRAGGPDPCIPPPSYTLVHEAVW